MSPTAPRFFLGLPRTRNYKRLLDPFLDVDRFIAATRSLGAKDPKDRLHSLRLQCYTIQHLEILPRRIVGGLDSKCG